MTGKKVHKATTKEFKVLRKPSFQLQHWMGSSLQAAISHWLACRRESHLKLFSKQRSKLQKCRSDARALQIQHVSEYYNFCWHFNSPSVIPAKHTLLQQMRTTHLGFRNTGTIICLTHAEGVMNGLHPCLLIGVVNSSFDHQKVWQCSMGN